MIDLSRVSKYYVACGYTDLRRGIDGLAAIVTQQFGRELREDSLFLFCGRRTDRIKTLYYSGDGYVLLYKRLNNGAFMYQKVTFQSYQQIENKCLLSDTGYRFLCNCPRFRYGQSGGV